MRRWAQTIEASTSSAAPSTMWTADTTTASSTSSQIGGRRGVSVGREAARGTVRILMVSHSDYIHSF